MKSLITICLLLASGIFISCDNSHDSGGGTPALMNFDSKLKLAYKIQGRGPDDKWITAFDTISFNPITINFDGSTWHTPFHSNDSIQIPEFQPFMANRADGLWTRSSLSDSAILLFKYPIQTGEKYSTDPNSPDFPQVVQMTGFATIMVGNLSYFCYAYEFIDGFSQGKSRRIIYIAPGYAIIKGVYIIDQGTSIIDTITYQLVP